MDPFLSPFFVFLWIKFISTLNFISNLQSAPVAISIWKMFILNMKIIQLYSSVFSAFFSTFKLIQVVNITEFGHIYFLFTNKQYTETWIPEWPDVFFLKSFSKYQWKRGIWWTHFCVIVSEIGPHSSCGSMCPCLRALPPPVTGSTEVCFGVDSSFGRFLSLYCNSVSRSHPRLFLCSL